MSYLIAHPHYFYVREWDGICAVFIVEIAFWEENGVLNDCDIEVAARECIPKGIHYEMESIYGCDFRDTEDHEVRMQAVRLMMIMAGFTENAEFAKWCEEQGD